MRTFSKGIEMLKKVMVFVSGVLALSAYAQQSPVITVGATEAAKELGVKCLSLPAAKDACVIAHFREVTAGAMPVASTFPSDYYRVLNGKMADGRYVATDYYKNGQQQSSSIMSNVVQAIPRSFDNVELNLTQSMIGWDPMGRKVTEFDLQNGMGEGKETMWYENGQKQQEGRNHLGKREGLWTFWYDNGVKQSEGIFKQGVKDGVWHTWQKDGSSAGQYHFNNGVAVHSKP